MKYKFEEEVKEGETLETKYIVETKTVEEKFSISELKNRLEYVESEIERWQKEKEIVQNKLDEVCETLSIEK